MAPKPAAKRKAPVTDWESDDEFNGYDAVVAELGAWKAAVGFSGAEAPDAIAPTAHRCEPGAARGPAGTGARKVARGESVARAFGMSHLSQGGDGRTVAEVWAPSDATGSGATTWAFSADAAADAVVFLAERTLAAALPDRPVVLVDPPGLAAAERQALVGALFGAGAPAVGIVPDAACASFAQGAARCVVVDVGHRGARCTAVCDGYTLRRSSGVVDFGGHAAGRNWMDAMVAKAKEAAGKQGDEAAAVPVELASPLSVMRLSVKGMARTYAVGDARLGAEEAAELRRRAGFHDTFHAVARVQAAHALMHVLAEGEKEHTLPPRTKWELPDGQCVDFPADTRAALGAVWFHAADDAAPVRRPKQALHHLIKQCLAKCEPELIPTLYDNVLLKGGGAWQSGLRSRLEDELTDGAPKNAPARVRRANERGGAFDGRCYPEHSSWHGAAIVAHTAAFTAELISRAQWDEQGGRVLEARVARF